MKILGIETSCDETAASIISGKGDNIEVLSNIVSSQIDIHKEYGGVIPEVAARQHVLNILPVVERALKEAGLDRNTASSGLDALAVTKGPGLVSSLMVGVETAKSLSLSWDLPLLPINHIQGHIYSNFLEFGKEIRFPAIVLTVSGGHTMLLAMYGHGDYQILGDTRDDAAGEAFDKAAQVMELGYPGGPILSRRAEEFKDRDVSSDIEFPRPMLKNNDFDFSFSGLKTSLLYKIKDDPDWREKVPAYCYKFQEAIVDVLSQKTLKAAKKIKAETVMLAGGVSANQELRKSLEKAVSDRLPSVKFFCPDKTYTTDNAAMIAVAGYYQALTQGFNGADPVLVDCNAEL